MAASASLESIPNRFKDDGCSYSPDSIMRNDISWVCRIHDFRYCSRTNPANSMDKKRRKRADKEMKQNMGLNLPWYVRWVRRIYYRAIRWFGAGDHSYNSCGIEVGDLCRHNMPVPLWMERRS